VLYTVHFTAFCLGGPFFPGHGVHVYICIDSAKCRMPRTAYRQDIQSSSLRYNM